MTTSTRPDVYSRITNRIIADLEQGVRPWSADHAAGRITRRSGTTVWRGSRPTSPGSGPTCATTARPAFLLTILDCLRASNANSGDRLLRCHTRLDQKSCSDRARPSQPTLAVDKNATAVSQDGVKQHADAAWIVRRWGSRDHDQRRRWLLPGW